MWELDYKIAECWRIDAFELWCWRRLLRVPWTARRSNQSILKEISPEYSLEGLMLKLQYFGHVIQIWKDSFEKTLMLGKIEGARRRGWQDEMVGWHHQLNGQEFELTLGDGERQGNLACCSLWGHKESDTTEWLNWTKLILTRSNTKRDWKWAKFSKDGRRMWWRKNKVKWKWTVKRDLEWNYKRWAKSTCVYK